MFAQVDPNWLQVVLQGGAMSLLALLLLYVVPRAVREIIAMMLQRDAKFTETINLLQLKQDERAEKLVHSIERLTERLAEKGKR